MAKFDLYSPFPPEECVDRLRTGLLNPSSDVDGRVEYDWIRLRKKIFYRNSFQTFLRAKLKPEGNGTRIRGSLGLHPFVMGFVALWFAGMSAGGFFGLINGGVFPQVLIPLVGIVGGIAGIGAGRLLVRGDRKLLIDFVTSSLETELTTLK